RGGHFAGGRVDPVDPSIGDLVQPGAVEGRAGIAGAVERAYDFAAVRVQGQQARAGGGPDPLSVVGDAVDGVGACARAVLAHDLGCPVRGARCFVDCIAVHRVSPVGAPGIGATTKIYR